MRFRYVSTLLPSSGPGLSQALTCDVHQQLVLRELLDLHLWHEVIQALLGEGGEVGRNHHDGALHTLCLHALSNHLWDDGRAGQVGNRAGQVGNWVAIGLVCDSKAVQVGNRAVQVGNRVATTCGTAGQLGEL